MVNDLMKLLFGHALDNRILVVLVLTAVKLSSCTEETGFKRLEPDVTLHNEVMFDQQVSLYLLSHISPNTEYELRISYPAVVPTEFMIRIYLPNQSQNFMSRHLLNIEKTSFITSTNTQGYVAEVAAHRIGFPAKRARLGDPVIFNIVLETMYHGLSIKSWKIVCYSLLLTAVSFKFLVPLVHRLIMTQVTQAEKGEHQC